jgi:hypothetical protein
MSIEDVDFLLENCETDSQIVYIDSGKRDKRTYPHPNHYSVKFNHDYRFVHGIDILDASIPSTMFNIDHDNNLLSYFTSASTANMQNVLLELDKLYGFQSLISYNKSVATGASYAPGTHNVFNIAVQDGVMPTSTTNDIFLNIEELAKYVYPCMNLSQLNIQDDPFDGYLSSSSTSTPKNLVFTRHKLMEIELYDTPQEATKGDLIVHEVVVPMGGTDKKYTSDPYFRIFDLAYQKKYGASSNMSFYDHLFNKPNHPKLVRSYYIEQDTACPSNCVCACTHDKTSKPWTVYYYTIEPVDDATFEKLPSTSSMWSPVSMLATVFKPGNYSVTDFMKRSVDIMTGSVGFDLTKIPDMLIYPYFRFTGNQPFILNMTGSSAANVLGFAESATNDVPDKYTHIPNKSEWFGSVKDGSGSDVIHAPGVVNFASTRYVIVRCDELEDHMFGSYSYSDFTPGIGLFRFFEVSGYSHQRVEYIRYDKAPFHPIGKLDRLTLTFLLPDLKTRYDFRGADHLMVLSIKYYVPKNKRKLQRSILNPSYNPDFRQYFQQYIDYRAAEEYVSSVDDDDQQEAKDIRKYEQDYDWENSEDGEDHEDGFSDIMP